MANGATYIKQWLRRKLASDDTLSALPKGAEHDYNTCVIIKDYII